MDLLERPSKQARHTPRAVPLLGSPTSITVRGIGARVDTPPIGIDRVAQEDTENVLRIMLSGYNMRAGTQPSGWSVEAEVGSGASRGRNLITGYIARLWGWEDKLHFTELQHLRNSDPLITDVEVDFNFKSHDEDPWNGALVIRVESAQSVINKQRLTVHLNNMDAAAEIQQQQQQQHHHHQNSTPDSADAGTTIVVTTPSPPPPLPHSPVTAAAAVVAQPPQSSSSILSTQQHARAPLVPPDDDLPPSMLALAAAGVVPTTPVPGSMTSSSSSSTTMPMGPPSTKKRGILAVFGL